MIEPSASKEDLAEIIGEYSAKLGIPMPSIVWNTKFESAVPFGDRLLISSESVESMSVNELRVEVGYAFARKAMVRFYSNGHILGLLAGAFALYLKSYNDAYAKHHGIDHWIIFVSPLALLFGIGAYVVTYHLGNRNADRIAYELTKDVEGMMQFLGTKGRMSLNGSRVPLNPKVVAKRMAQLEGYIQSQVVGESQQ